MADVIRGQARMTIGIDLGDKWSHLCVLDEAGEIDEEGRIRTTPDAMRKRFEASERCRIAIETGTHSLWVHRLLEELGHEVFSANPRAVRLIYRSKDKDDRLDAERLARIARLDPRLLSPVRQRGKSVQIDRAVLHSRDILVRARTKLINHTRGIVKSLGGRLPSCSAPCFATNAREAIPKELRPALVPVLESISMLTVRIRRCEKHIRKLLAKRYPETEVLSQIQGVGPLTALSFVLVIEDPTRFPSSRMLGAYLGLCPRRSQSGGQDPELRITKAGDSDLRRLLVGSAHYILGPFGPDTDLKRYGQKLAARGNKTAKKRAVVAVARKLAVLLHRLWITAEVYEPLRNNEPGLNHPRQAAQIAV